MRKSARRAQGFAILGSVIFLATFIILLPFGATAVAQSDANSEARPCQAGRAAAPSSKGDANLDGAGSSDVRAGHILVRFKALPSQDVLNRLGVEFAANVVGTIPGIRITHLQVAGPGLALLHHLRNRPDVEFAEFDSVVKTFQSTFVPNDPYYSGTYASSHNGNVDQWGPAAVSAPAAWGVTLGSSGIVIAIVDTGVDDSHPDLASKV